MAGPTTAKHRNLLLSLFEKAVAVAHPSLCVPPHLPPVPEGQNIIVIGAGKAASAMVKATEEHYCAQGTIDRVSGGVTTRHGFELPTDHLTISLAGHPVPDDGSLTGATSALQAVRSATENTTVLCLLSGGASALWSAPVDGVTLAEKQELTKQLLKSGAPITEINCVRKHLSAIKGGRLAAHAYPAKLLTLAISDVAGDNPDAIGSGPTVADSTTLQDARDIVSRYGLTPPPAIVKALADPKNETLKPGDNRLQSASYKLVAMPKASLDAAATLLQADGYEIEMLGDCVEGEARDVAREHAIFARRCKQHGRKVAILSGGELTVTIRGDGQGGPNQEYALSMAVALDGEEGIYTLAGDTDGTDGGRGEANDPAGALVFPDTLRRAAARDLIAANFLENNDSSTFFQAIGDLIVCGPTQTNVNDFRVTLVDPGV